MTARPSTWGTGPSFPLPHQWCSVLREQGHPTTRGVEDFLAGVRMGVVRGATTTSWKLGHFRTCGNHSRAITQRPEFRQKCVIASLGAVACGRDSGALSG
jgi:hypothetical protein